MEGERKFFPPSADAATEQPEVEDWNEGETLLERRNSEESADGEGEDELLPEDWERKFLLQFRDVGAPIVSPDGKNFAFAARERGRGKKKDVITVNGTPWEERFEAADTPEFSPDSSKVMARVSDEKGVTIAVNGEVWAGHFKELREETFSQDSAHVAAAVRTKGKGETIIVNDATWPRWFQTAWGPAFSPDSKRIAAAVRDRKGETIAVDGKPWDRWFQLIGSPHWSPNGEHIACWTTEVTSGSKVRIGAIEEGRQERATIVMDGTPWEQWFKAARNLEFSPDSARVAAIVADDRGYTIAVNGVPWEERFDEILDFSFSPDGTKILCIARKKDDEVYRVVKRIQQ